MAGNYATSTDTLRHIRLPHSSIILDSCPSPLAGDGFVEGSSLLAVPFLIQHIAPNFRFLPELLYDTVPSRV